MSPSINRTRISCSWAQHKPKLNDVSVLPSPWVALVITTDRNPCDARSRSNRVLSALYESAVVSSEGLPLKSSRNRSVIGVSSFRHSSKRNAPGSPRGLELLTGASEGATAASFFARAADDRTVGAFRVSLKNLLIFPYSSVAERFCFIASISVSTMDRFLPLIVGTGSGIALLSGASTLADSRRPSEMAASSTMSSSIVWRFVRKPSDRHASQTKLVRRGTPEAY